MVQTEKEIVADLKAGKFRPVYLLTGEENYYIDLVSNFFEKNVIAADFRDFDQTVVYGPEVDMPTVIDLAKRYPMMSPVQLVLVKEAQGIARDWELLAKYLENPQPQTVLVFCYRHKKLNKNSKAYKAINSVGVVFEKNKLRDYEVPGWIANVVQKKGYSITQTGAVLIAESLGNDLGKIANELSKVYISMPEGGTINEDVIETNIGISKEYNAFELQNAIGRRDVVQCNKIVNHFAANPKDNPIQLVIASLYGYFIKVMLYHQEPDKNKAASVLKVSPYFLKDYEKAAQNYSLGKLASCIGYLYEADLKSKGVRNNGTISDGEILKELVFKIIH
ncbi:MAG: DNA polymerase III subunit delta [Bacteroidales bacterium]|jgi:DNA polymerase-3 subunit delta|nr:DNA polymerase III subunit delta [Bacteroidales bacterium]